MRAGGRLLLATLLADNPPVAIARTGAVTLKPEDATTASGLESGLSEILEAVRRVMPGVERIVVRGAGGDAPAKPGQRLTLESVREERMANLRRRDPALAVAIETLDLELLD